MAKKPTDATGVMLDKLKADNAEAQAERAAQMSMATAQAQVKLETEVIDATQPDRQTIVVDEAVTVGKKDDSNIEIRVVEDIENMTLGVGNTYNFKAGQKYKVTKQVAQHLKEKGYLANSI